MYLQLYNLVELTITRCVSAVAQAACDDAKWHPGDLCGELRQEWVRVIARTHLEMTFENRLKAALALFEILVEAWPIEEWSVEKGGGGNWDDREIEAIAARVGLRIRVSRPARTGVRRHLRDDKGCLALVKSLRNQLAHGRLSFSECGENVTVSELSDLTKRTVRYLREVVAAFSSFIADHEFLIPERRPAIGAPNL